jgi:PAS domain S-box-containing protein
MSIHERIATPRIPDQAFLDTLPLAVYVCDSPSGEILRFNDVAKELWGTAPEPGTRLCGSMALFLPDGTPLPVEQCPMAFAVREGKAYIDQYVLMQRPDGARFIANVNIAPIRDHQCKLIGAINAFQDVTPRRRSEMLLEAQRSLLERIVSGDALDSVLREAAHAAEKYALAQAFALIYVRDGEQLRLAAAPSMVKPALPELEVLPVAHGAAPELACPRTLAHAGGMRLAHTEPVFDARHEVCGLFALYEPFTVAAQTHRFDGLGLLSRTIALAIEREALVKAERLAVRERDESLVLSQQAESAARATADRLRMLLEGLPAAAYTCDRDGRITYFNKRAVELWGREPKLNDQQDRYCGSYKLYLSHDEPIEHSQCWMALALKNGRRYEGREIRIERPDGSTATALAHAMPFQDEQGAITGAVNVLVDISERKAAESTLRASEERLRAIVDTTPECVKLVAADGTLLHMNAAGLAMVGAERPGQVLGKSVYELISPEHRASFIAFNEKICRGERGTLEFDIIGLNGHRRNMETHAAPFRNDNAIVQLAITRDITERRRTEAERERFAARLAESDRRKDEFIATLSHELRNPLAPLRTSVHLLAQEAQRDPAAVRTLKEIMARQVDHLVRLVDDLLEASRITRGTFDLRKERVALASVVRHAMETSKAAMESAGHQLDLTLPEEPLWLDGDSVRLVQILSNLLNNAVKYTEPKGKISLLVLRDGTEAVIRVRDNGMGIAADMIARLFEMFARGHYAGERGRSGLGVGLAISRRLAEMHGGTITVRSEGPGKGSEFEVRLPLADPQKPHTLPERTQGERLTSDQRVLVVDDNRDAADTLCMLLTAAGAQARVGRDGPEAIAIIESYNPTTVLLDIGMPGMNGYEVAREIRKRYQRPIVLVALTGWGQHHDRQRAFAAGFDHHVVKPAALEDLLPLLK